MLDGPNKPAFGGGIVVLKILKYVGVAIACLVLLAVSSALLYRKYLQHKVAQARAITSPNGIESLEPVRIGGIDQWIEVRGQDVKTRFSYSFMVVRALPSCRYRVRFKGRGRNILRWCNGTSEGRGRRTRRTTKSFSGGP